MGHYEKNMQNYVIWSFKVKRHENIWKCIKITIAIVIYECFVIHYTQFTVWHVIKTSLIFSETLWYSQNHLLCFTINPFRPEIGLLFISFVVRIYHFLLHFDTYKHFFNDLGGVCWFYNKKFPQKEKSHILSQWCNQKTNCPNRVRVIFLKTSAFTIVSPLAMLPVSMLCKRKQTLMLKI